MGINKYFPFAVIYFFFNSLGLPLGLTYMALLSPVLYYWVLITRKKEVLWPFLLAAIPFVLVQINEGVDQKTYIASFLNITTVYVFCQAFYTFLVYCKDKEGIFRKLVIINFLFCLIAIPLYFTDYYGIFWIQQFLTKGVNDFKRFKLFTYEASYYATLFTPLFFFYFLKVNLSQNKKNSWLILLVIILPYLLSFSLGVFGSILISILVMYAIMFRYVGRQRRSWYLIFFVTGSIVSIALILFIFFPDNTLFIRMGNVMSGNDTSGNGRTFDAFFLGNKILHLRNIFFGIGPGQVKVIGADIIRNYYNYSPDYNVISIPNSTAETLAIFGVIGLFLRFGAEIFFFFYTRVWTNYYRLVLFLFIFLYQFTGSFITNLAEYVIWILAFTNVFPEFNVRNRVLPGPGKTGEAE
jgi:hypothetical protein